MSPEWELGVVVVVVITGCWTSIFPVERVKADERPTEEDELGVSTVVVVVVVCSCDNTWNDEQVAITAP